MKKNDYSAYIGLDVHKDSIAVAIATSERQSEVRFWGNIAFSYPSITRLLKKLSKLYPSFLTCYEAGPTGYNLYRFFISMGIDCIVVAPSRIPNISTQRIKNDHRDAVGLARLLRAGELSGIWVPDAGHEAMRDLVRARACAKHDEKIAKQRIQSMLLRTGRKYDKKSWTVRHKIWLANQSFDLSSQQIAFEHYKQSLEQIENRILQLDKEIDHLLPNWSLFNLVTQLQALKGVGKLIAISLATEIGDFSRFSNPKQIMAFLGMIPGEHSSGKTIRHAGITKTGNPELRRLLYEAAWSYRNNAKVGQWLITHRPENLSQEAKDISWKAQQRLCFRYRHLLAKGKRSQVAITAVARELLGFMWDIAITTQKNNV